jgi:5-carboxymethyl-2-hydroxymuconate isomerase
MPHLKIEYTGNIEAQAGMNALCKALARTLVELEDGQGRTVFPFEGTRVLAYPAPHHAVADGEHDKAFVYLNLRIAPGRGAALLQQAGDALLAQTREHFAALPARRPLRITLHIDEGSPVYEGKLS